MRRVVIVAFDGVQPLDVVGPAEVFSTAARIRPPGYTVEVVAPSAEPIRGSSVSLAPDRAITSCRGPIDTLICAGGTGVREAAKDERLIRWIKAAARRSRRTASVCTGAFLLAEAGLLNGRKATTHWSACAALARSHPKITVEPDPIFVHDTGVYTSAGVTAGMDLALALVDEDEGRDVSLEVARWLVLFLRRPGGQSQFSAQLAAQTAEREPLKELQAWIPDNLDGDLSVPALARRVSMSERNFARAFRREVGMTPAAYVESSRVESARIALESGGEPVELVAHRTGFGTVETMRRAFRRRLGVSPSDYRDRFNAQEAA